jgi:ankyrin repeat protein
MHQQLHHIRTFNVCLALALLTGGCFLFGPGHSDYRPIHQYSLACDDQNARAILATNSAVVNLRDDSDRTPLHDAASRNCTNVIAVLVRAGAKLDARDQAGETPLHVAAQEGCSEAATMLIDAGAAINARDKKGYTPLKRALLYDQTATAQLLRNLGAQE